MYELIMNQESVGNRVNAWHVVLKITATQCKYCHDEVGFAMVVVSLVVTDVPIPYTGLGCVGMD